MKYNSLLTWHWHCLREQIRLLLLLQQAQGHLKEDYEETSSLLDSRPQPVFAYDGDTDEYSLCLRLCWGYVTIACAMQEAIHWFLQKVKAIKSKSTTAISSSQLVHKRYDEEWRVKNSATDIEVTTRYTLDAHVIREDAAWCIQMIFGSSDSWCCRCKLIAIQAICSQISLGFVLFSLIFHEKLLIYCVFMMMSLAMVQKHTTGF